MQLKLAGTPVPRHLWPVFAPGAFPKGVAKRSAMDIPDCSRGSRRSIYRLLRSCQCSQGCQSEFTRRPRLSGIKLLRYDASLTPRSLRLTIAVEHEGRCDAKRSR